jgi:hypothetical protein
MAGDVSSQVPAVAVPTGVTLGLRLETGALAKVRHHPIRFELEQVVFIQILRMLQWSTGESHCRQGQGMSNLRNRVLDLLGTSGPGENQDSENKNPT